MTRNGNDKALSGKSGDAAPKKKRVGPFQYLQQVRQEARKVTWTPFDELRVSTILVLILTVIAILFFWGLDSLIQFVVRFLLSLGA